MESDIIIEKELDEIGTEEIDKIIDTLNIMEYDNLEEIIDATLSGKPLFNQKEIIDSIWELFIYEIKGAVIMGLEIFAVTVLIALLKSSSNTFGESSVSKVGAICSCAAIISVAMIQLADVYELVENTLDTLTYTMEIILPVMIVLLTASGGLTSAALINPLISGVTTALNSVLLNIVAPLIYFSAVLFLLDSIFEKKFLEDIAKLIRNGATFITGLMVSIFSGITVIQGIAGKASDSLLMEGARFTAGNFIPIIGGFAADSIELAVACVRMIKNTLGIVGIIILLCILITPVIKITAAGIIYKLISIAVLLTGEDRISSSLKGAGSSIIMLSVITALDAFMFLIFFAVMISIGGTGG